MLDKAGSCYVLDEISSRTLVVGEGDVYDEFVVTSATRGSHTTLETSQLHPQGSLGFSLFSSIWFSAFHRLQ